MTGEKDTAKHLARDYLDGAGGFLLAAEKILNSVGKESSEWIFQLEGPVCFLICHAAELILKAGLALEAGFNEVKFTHDLSLLIQRSSESQILMNADFCHCALMANDNFLKHDYRYQRTFAGFPDAEQVKLLLLMKEDPQAASEEGRKHGLVVRRALNLELYLKASRAQLSTTAEWIDTK